ncbi:MAG: hypothetical protein KBC07_02485 [Bacteroidales bacterium]|jgi:hypothetical protein|nr:hypothetical protein [Bacteroidales bacterium]NLH23661.1 hypothetical protein [Bacteroidales bacterium]
MKTTHKEQMRAATLSEQTRGFLSLMGAIDDLITEFNGICPDEVQRESVEDGDEDEHIYEKIIDHLAEARSGFQTIMFQVMQEKMYSLNCTEI